MIKSFKQFILSNSIANLKEGYKIRLNPKTNKYDVHYQSPRYKHHTELVASADTRAEANFHKTVHRQKFIRPRYPKNKSLDEGYSIKRNAQGTFDIYHRQPPLFPERVVASGLTRDAAVMKKKQMVAIDQRVKSSESKKSKNITEKSLQTEADTPFEVKYDGFRSADHGLHFNTNPHKPSSIKHHQWNLGYAEHVKQQAYLAGKNENGENLVRSEKKHPYPSHPIVNGLWAKHFREGSAAATAYTEKKKNWPNLFKKNNKGNS